MCVCVCVCVCVWLDMISRWEGVCVCVCVCVGVFACMRAYVLCLCQPKVGCYFVYSCPISSSGLLFCLQLSN